MAPKPSRNFLQVATLFMCTFAVGAGVWHLGGAMAPDASAEIKPRTVFDLQSLAPGEEARFLAGNKHIIVRRLTEAQTEEVRAVPLAELLDQDAANANLAPDALATFEIRALELDGIFVVLENRGISPFSYFLPDHGDFGGWWEGLYAAHYDVLGRLRKGHGINMPIPAYEVLEDGRIGFWHHDRGMTEDELDRILYGAPSS